MEINELLKNKKIVNVALILLIGIIVFIMGKSMIDTDKSPPKTEQKQDEVAMLEGRLEKILSTIKGAGKVSVFVVLDDLGAYDYVKDIKQVNKENQNENEEKTVLAGGGSNNAPIIAKAFSPNVKGIIVTAEGAGNPEVKEKIKTAVETALAIMPHRVEVTQRIK